jgi:hypothetical protein
MPVQILYMGTSIQAVTLAGGHFMDIALNEIINGGILLVMIFIAWRYYGSTRRM